MANETGDDEETSTTKNIKSTTQKSATAKGSLRKRRDRKKTRELQAEAAAAGASVTEEELETSLPITKRTRLQSRKMKNIQMRKKKIEKREKNNPEIFKLILEKD